MTRFCYSWGANLLLPSRNSSTHPHFPSTSQGGFIPLCQMVLQTVAGWTHPNFALACHMCWEYFSHLWFLSNASKLQFKLKLNENFILLISETTRLICHLKNSRRNIKKWIYFKNSRHNIQVVKRNKSSGKLEYLINISDWPLGNWLLENWPRRWKHRQ